MRTRHPRLGVSVGLIFAASSALAANGIDVTRGQDAMVFGNCVPSLVVENNSMEIIDYLEPVKRGVYAGAVGYIGWNGNMDTAIAIRTAVIRDGRLYVQAGAGIVADSQPRSEWDETMNKARAVFRAVALAAAGLEGRHE